MLLKRKRKAIIDWFNCVINLDGPLESLQQLSDGHHFRKLINLIDCTSEEELPDEAEIYEFIEKFLNGYFHSQVGALINIPACSEGDEFELAKISILLLSAVVQQSLSKENNFLSSLTVLEEGVQEDIRDCIQSVILFDGGKLSSEFSGVLKRGNTHTESPFQQTPRRRTRRSAAFSSTSPLLSFVDSPMFAQQAKIRTLQSTVTSLQQVLHAEENKVTELEVENENLKKSIKDLGKEIKDLKEKIGEFNASRESAEELSWASIEKYNTDIESLKQQLRECQNLEVESLRLQKENAEYLSCNNSLQSKLEDYDMMKSRSQILTSDLHQAQTTIESQKEVIEEIHIQNNNLKRQIDTMEKDMRKVQSLYDDAMREVRKLQNSPELPKGESMGVVTEMKLAEREKEIKALKEEELELRDHLKTSTLCNESLKKDIAAVEEKCSETEERLTAIIQLKERELSELHSNLSLITNEKYSLQQQIQNILSEMDHLKKQSKQQYIEYQENEVKLRADLSEINSKMKISYEKEKDSMEAQNDALSHELKQVMVKLGETENKLKTIVECKEKEITELKLNITTSNQENSLLKEKLQNLRNEMDCVKQAGEQKLKSITAEMESVRNQAKHLVDVYEVDKAKLKEELSEVKSKLKFNCEKEEHDQNSLNRVISEKDALLHELEITVAKVNETENRLNAIIKRKEDEASDHNSTIVLLKEGNSHLRKKFHDLKDENDHLKKTLDCLKKQQYVEHEGNQKKLKTELSEVKLKSCEKDDHGRNFLHQVISQKNALTEELKSCRTNYSELELKFSKHLEDCENGKDTEGLRGALDRLAAENIHLQKQLDMSKAEQQDVINKLVNTERDLTTSVAQEKEKENYIEKLCKETQDLHDVQNQKDKIHDEEIKKLEDSLQNMKEKTKSSESKLLIELKNLKHCIEEKNICIEKANEELQKAKETTECKDHELMTIKNTLKEVHMSYSELVNEMSQLKLEKAKHEEIIAQLRHKSNKVDSLQNCIEELKNENENLRLHINSFDSENNKLMNQLKETGQNVNSLMEKSRQKDENIDTLSKHIKKLEALIQDNVDHKAEMKKFQDLLHNSQEENEAIVSKYSGEVQNLNHCIQEKEESLVKAHKEIEELKEMSKKKDEEIRTVENKLQEVKASKSNLLHEISYKNNITIESLEDSVKKLSKENSDLQKCVKNLNSEKLEVIKVHEDVELRLINLTKEKQKRDDFVDKQLQELQEIQNQKDINHEAEIKEVKELLHKSLQENEESKVQHLTEVNNLNQHIQNKERHLEKLLDSVKELEKQKLQKNEEIREIEKQLKEQKDSSSLLLSEKSTLQEELLRNKDIVAHLKSNVRRITTCYQEKENEMDKTWKNVESENEALKKEIIIKNEKVGELETTLNCITSSKEREIHELCLDLKRLKEENQIFQHQVELLEHQTTDYKLDIIRLKEELSVINTRMQDFCESKVCEDSRTAVEMETLSKQVKECQALYESTKQNHLEHLKTCCEKDDTIKTLSISLETLVCERDDFQKSTENLDISKQELMEKLEDTERRHDNLIKQKEIAESDFSRCVEKRDADIEKLHKQIQELEEVQNKQCENHTIKLKEVQNLLQESQSYESKLLIEVQNLNQCLQQKQMEIKKSCEKVHQLEDIVKQKDESLLKIKYSIQEAEAARCKLITEISCLTEEKQLDKEKIDRLTSENKRIPSYQQQQKKMIEEMKQIEQKTNDYKKKNEQNIESFKKITAKLQKEKEELEKRIASLKQKLVGYQNVSENYKQVLNEERKHLKLAKEELEESKQFTGDLRKRIALLENAAQNYKERILCLESESRRSRAELNEMRKYNLDDHLPVARRFSSSLCTPSKRSGSPADDSTLSPCVWKKPAVKKRMSNCSNTASCISTSNETVNALLDITPVKAGASSLFLPLADEEDFLNYSSLAELKSGPPSVTKSTKRLSELQRRNTLCPPHMQSSYPVETQMRPVSEFSDDSFRSGHALENSRKNNLAEPRLKTHKISPKRKRSGSEERAEKVKKVSRTTEIWQSFKASIASPRTDVQRTPTAFKNVFAVNKRRNQDVHKKIVKHK